MERISLLRCFKLILLTGLVIWSFSASGLRLEGEQAGWIKGREALRAIMLSARHWASDAEAIRLYSGACKNALGDGLCEDWRAVVVSRSQKKSAGFYWSRGYVRHEKVADYDVESSGERAIEIAKIKSDSDEAFRISKEHGGKALLEKNPETEIRYAMMLEKRIGQLIWLVFYDIHGTEFSSAKLHVALNAETGKFIQ